MKIKSLIIIAIFFSISGCGKNPLIGEWTKVESSGRKLSIACSNLQYTSSRVICDSMSSEVSYEISDTSVIVKEESPLFNVDLVVKIISNDIISYTDIFSKEEIFYIRRGTHDITAESIKYYRQYTLAELERSCSSGPAKVEHPSKYWSETLPAQIHKDICTARDLKKKST